MSFSVRDRPGDRPSFLLEDKRGGTWITSSFSIDSTMCLSSEIQHTTQFNHFRWPPTGLDLNALPMSPDKIRESERCIFGKVDPNWERTGSSWGECGHNDSFTFSRRVYSLGREACHIHWKKTDKTNQQTKTPNLTKREVFGESGLMLSGDRSFCAPILDLLLASCRNVGKLYLTLPQLSEIDHSICYVGG